MSWWVDDFIREEWQNMHAARHAGDGDGARAHKTFLLAALALRRARRLASAV